MVIDRDNQIYIQSEVDESLKVLWRCGYLDKVLQHSQTI